MESTTPAANTEGPKALLEREGKLNVLYLTDPVEGVRELHIELVPEKRVSPNARTLKLCEPPRIEVPTDDGVISIEIRAWLTPPDSRKRAPVILSLG